MIIHTTARWREIQGWRPKCNGKDQSKSNSSIVDFVRLTLQLDFFIYIMFFPNMATCQNNFIVDFCFNLLFVISSTKKKKKIIRSKMMVTKFTKKCQQYLNVLFIYHPFSIFFLFSLFFAFVSALLLNSFQNIFFFLIRIK